MQKSLLEMRLTSAIYAAAAAMIILVAVSAFISPTGSWPLAIVAVALVFAANLDRFSEVSAGTSGFTAKMRAAEGKINELQKLIEVVASAELYQIQSASRWVDSNDDEQRIFLARIVRLMEEIGVAPDRIREIKAETWDKYVRFDYVCAILGGGYAPVSSDSALLAEWKAMRNLQDTPSPAKLADFLARHGDKNDLRAEFLHAYEHYWTSGTHLDEALWKRRIEIPNLGGTRSYA